MLVFELDTWQWTVVGAVGVVCVGYMALTIARMQRRRAGVSANLREGTPVESGLAGFEPPSDTRVFDAKDLMWKELGE